MKIQMMIGAMAVAFLFMNQSENGDTENNISSPNLIVEAILKFSPRSSVEGEKVWMKSGNAPYGSDSENLKTGREIEPATGQEKYIINIEQF